MKREIKFRAKIVMDIKSLAMKKGHWVEGHYYEDLQDGEWCSWIKECNDIIHYKVDKDTVGQFTGLLDKNGKEIYEGDIIRYTDIDSFVVNPDCDPWLHFRKSYAVVREEEVVFDGGMFCNDEGRPICHLGWESIKDLRECLGVTDGDDCDVDGTIVNDSLLGIEVIGNIHDNPELLKGGAE